MKTVFPCNLCNNRFTSLAFQLQHTKICPKKPKAKENMTKLSFGNTVPRVSGTQKDAGARTRKQVVVIIGKVTDAGARAQNVKPSLSTTEPNAKKTEEAMNLVCQTNELHASRINHVQKVNSAAKMITIRSELESLDEETYDAARAKTLANLAALKSNKANVKAGGQGIHVNLAQLHSSGRTETSSTSVVNAMAEPLITGSPTSRVNTQGGMSSKPPAVGESVADTTCYVCGWKSNTRSDLKRHMSVHSSKTFFHCAECSFNSNHKSALTLHVNLVHRKENPFVCTEFQYSCGERDLAKTHATSRSNAKPHACTVCEYTCLQSGHMTAHMRVHTGEKPYSCTVCNYRAAHRNSLKGHMLNHTGEKPYACNLCSYRTAHRNSLKSHMLNHTGEKTYACTVCSYRAAHSTSLKSHMLNHTGEKPYVCTVCNYRAAQSSVFKTHMCRHTGEKPYACHLCSYRTAHRNSLKKHMNTHSRRRHQPDATQRHVLRVRL